jgi:hypothetical protein
MKKPLKKPDLTRIKQKMMELKKEIVYNKSIKTKIYDESLLYTDRTNILKDFLAYQADDANGTGTLDDTLRIDDDQHDTLNLTYRSHGINDDFNLIQMACEPSETVLKKPGYEDMIRTEQTFLIE